VLINEPEL